jgi:hypothetical protein
MQKKKVASTNVLRNATTLINNNAARNKLSNVHGAAASMYVEKHATTQTPTIAATAKWFQKQHIAIANINV